ncbi:hypothetical protein P152DRAFT_259197 [Eremomyces bilateralis CBS 781.70]|uniref:Myb-like domain-containing protein n=1 Tax=Eremomyces bilateralis CBS 781.70 TaxID=1392243 RepID=A0A6G1FQL5_9PEZI|nr:uncharacterized protein P152DRAFT_259197 [Eremomyces bilateralis CBS 781.70]KAF1808000.1 hypothetical protein P152DRAFT_259197 [Eremomyces bilateralis CBS 781.70]
MTATTAPCSSDTQSHFRRSDNFRYYSGLPKSQRPKTRTPNSGHGAGDSTNTLWTDIDDILESEGLTRSNPAQQSAGGASTGNCPDTAILVENSESYTGSEDELPALNVLLSAGSQRPELSGSSAADRARDSSSSQAIESGDILPPGQNDEPSNGVDVPRSGTDMSHDRAMDDSVSVADHTRLPIESLVQSTETAESTNLQPLEETDGNTNENNDPIINPSSIKQRKWTRSSSRTTPPADLNAARGARSQHQIDSQPLEEPRPAKRSRRSRSGEPPPPDTVAPNIGFDSSGRCETPRICHRVERQLSGSGDAEISPQNDDEGDAANNRGRGRSEHINRDRSGNRVLTSTSPPPAPSPHTIRAYQRRETDDPIQEHSQLRDTADYGRCYGYDTDEVHAVDDDHGIRSLRPPLGRRHRGKIQRRRQPFQSNAGRNTPTFPRDQRATRPPSSPNPDHPAARRNDGDNRDGDDSGPVTVARFNVTDISLRPTPGDTFLAATVKADGDIGVISYSKLLTLIENILGVPKIQDITLKPLAAGQWLLTGFIRNHYLNAGVTTQHEVTSNPRRDTTEATVPMANTSDSEDDCSVGRSDSTVSDDEAGDEKYIDQGIDGGTRRRWEPLEEQRLLAYKAEGKPWPWIFRKFPDRTPGAVRVRWHMLHRSQEAANDATEL